VASSSPGKSGLLASGSRLSGTRERVIARFITASGTLMKKAARQGIFSAE
jgi:hypothetical protein